MASALSGVKYSLSMPGLQVLLSLVLAPLPAAEAGDEMRAGPPTGPGRSCDPESASSHRPKQLVARLTLWGTAGDLSSVHPSGCTVI